MRGRLAAVVAALAVSVPVSALVTAAPAAASAPACSSASEAHWSTQRQYSYYPGAWCMTDGFAEVVWQPDGNLVWYARDGHPLWQSDTCQDCTWTSLTGARWLSFQVDGNIVVYRYDGKPLWRIGASSNRRSTTQFYWELYESGGCKLDGTVYDLDQTQVDPDPALSHNLSTWGQCY